MSERAENERDRVGPRAHAHRMRGAHGPGEFRLERLHLGAEDEPAARDDALDGGADLDPIVTRHERHEGHARCPPPGGHTPSGERDSCGST